MDAARRAPAPPRPVRRWLEFEGISRPKARPSASPEPPRWRRAAFLVPLAVLALAAGLRLWSLGSPSSTIMDEGYYVHDAEAYVGGQIDLSGAPRPSMALEDEVTWMHPPLGKYLIGLGDWPTVGTSWGWRLPSALFGIAGVWIVYLTGLALWRSVWWAGLGAIMLALDGLHIVQSRAAMLDVFLTTFVSAGFLFLVWDRTRGSSRAAAGGWMDRAFGGRYRLCAGAMFGLAIATKWSGAFALLAAIALTAAGRGDAEGRARRAATTATSFVAVPLLIYTATYAQAFVEHGPNLILWLRLQWDMARAQVQTPPVLSASRPLSWPLLLHPLQYYPRYVLSTLQTHAPRQIWAFGNPVLWYGCLAAVPVAAWRAVRARDWRFGWILAFAGAMYLPWLATSRAEYLYYMTPVVPFMALLLAGVVRCIHPVRLARGTAIGIAGAAAASAALYAPVWLGLTASIAWLARFHLPPRWP
jgi:dolichyl-phosphate-mannose--protein O-mannosyl transferase